MNHEQSTSLMAITRIDTTHVPTYSMATAMEASACPIDKNAFICSCHLLDYFS